MSIKLEQIDELVKRTGASYEEAKEALEKCNEDVVEAIIYLEKGKKTKNTEEYSLWDSVKKIIKKGNNISFIIAKKDRTVLNIPLTLAIPVAVIFPPIAIVTIILALFTNHKIRFEKKSGEGMKVNDMIDKISNGVAEIKNEMVECADEK